ncbi:hypothetical protein K457DRAFT_127169 [Linnemannia elongata AG-77]|uniref:Uncharacterized protein n=1 Tax=Linnemannia elongata AG-77 TaxID=1314771 RepID=A0A197JRB1_9FUNG|nr:hypothetical protein K457DRAFT_127169 [Linnemannia elongata AG-77]
MDGSNEEQVQGIVWFQNTVMALLGYSQMGSERLYQIEDNIDSLKADLSILFKQLTDNNKELSAKQNKILDNAVKLMNKTEGLLDRIEKFTSERHGWQTDSQEGSSMPGSPVDGRFGLGINPRRYILHLDDHDQVFSEFESPEYENSAERNMAQAQVIARHNEEFSRGMDEGEENEMKKYTA